jgi:hypothetical protein
MYYTVVMSVIASLEIWAGFVSIQGSLIVDCVRSASDDSANRPVGGIRQAVVIDSLSV